MYGLTTHAKDGGPSPAMKPTRWLTNSPQMAAHLQKCCDHSHSHQVLEGGRPANAAFYPLKCLQALLRGIRDTHEAILNVKDATAVLLHQDPHDQEEEKVQLDGAKGTPPQNFFEDKEGKEDKKAAG